jgi:hypothetical protein
VRLRSSFVALTVAAALGGCGASESHGGDTSGPTASSTTQSAPAAPASVTTTPKVASTPVQSAKHATATAPAPVSKTSSKEPKPEEQLGGTPFLDAAGSGFAAFHAYISKPLRRGTLKLGGAPAAIATAAKAATYAKSEIAAAAQAAGQSASLQSLVGSLDALEQRLGTIQASLDAGRLDTAAIAAARAEVNAISRAALAAGQPIQEVAPKLP